MTTLPFARTGHDFRFPVTDDEIRSLDGCTVEVADDTSRESYEYPGMVRALAAALSDLAATADSPVQILMDYIDAGDDVGRIDGVTVALPVRAFEGISRPYDPIPLAGSPVRLLTESRPIDDLCLRSQTGHELLIAVVRSIGEMGNDLLDEFGPTTCTYVHS